MSDAKPVFNLLVLVVGEMGPMVDFYRRLGVEIEDPTPEWPDVHRGGQSGSVGVDLDHESFTPNWNAGWPAGRTGPLLGFGVPTREAVDALYAELTGAGHQGSQEPFDAFWGARYAVVVDPEGTHVGIMSPTDPDRRSAPPQ
jgi:hypothetical protein